MASKRQRPHGSGSLFKRAPRGPWIARWFDCNGKRVERSTRTTDRAAAERIIAKKVADVALRRDGVIDANKDRFAVEGRKPLTEHFVDYLDQFRRKSRSKDHVKEKVRILDRIAVAPGMTTLATLTPDTLEPYLWELRDSGLSARTVNFHRQTAAAFMSWCVKKKRAASNPLTTIPKLNEDRDRRRVRRPLTDEEFARLLAIARDRGRAAWYLCAGLAGLRRSDLIRLVWADIDLEHNSITISEGKADRVDVLPIHPQLAEELQRLRAERLPMPTARVFPTAVTDRTVRKDFLRAGLARLETVFDADGKTVMIGKSKHRRPKMRITTEDDEGRVLDLHALRTTLGTNLARSGVAPQLAQKIMRHSDYRTTQKHYTVLGLTDTAAAIERMPGIRDDKREGVKATGTHDGTTELDPRHLPRQLGRETLRDSAAGCGKTSTSTHPRHSQKPLQNKCKSDTTRDVATPCDKAGERIRTADVQLGKSSCCL
jgi:integrase